LLKSSAIGLSFEDLDMRKIVYEKLKAEIAKPNGMVITTGPTGSGKTTTLYAILNTLNNQDTKIITLENPIEYKLKGVVQSQIDHSKQYTFALGLRSILRQDPDIIMVGEIRDLETAQTAVDAALTGHLMLSTIHTNDASGAIPRLLDMGVEGFLVASTTNAIMAQRLVRKSCQSCLVPYEPSPGVLARLAMEGQSVAGQKFYKGQGCAQCHNSGYQGRLSVCEVLPVTEKIRELVTKRSASDVIKRQAIEEGMITMMQDGLNKVASGQTTIEEVLRAVMED
jgi:type II secretory ATPase GspE/PulE/Tfp pilus assembly ATPase PilB-like protein